LLDSKSAESPMPQTALNMNFCGKILKMKTRVTVKKKKKMMMRSKVKMRTLSNKLSFQKMLVCSLFK
jgi:hypothetical protein